MEEKFLSKIASLNFLNMFPRDEKKKFLSENMTISKIVECGLVRLII